MELPSSLITDWRLRAVLKLEIVELQMPYLKKEVTSGVWSMKLPNKMWVF